MAASAITMVANLVFQLMFFRCVLAGEAVDGLIEFKMSWDGDQDELAHWVWKSRDQRLAKNSSSSSLGDTNKHGRHDATRNGRKERDAVEISDKQVTSHRKYGLGLVSSSRQLVASQILRGDDITRSLKRPDGPRLLPGVLPSAMIKGIDGIHLMSTGRAKRHGGAKDHASPAAECVHRPTSRDRPSDRVKDEKGQTADLSGRHVIVMREEQEDVKLSCHYCNEEEEEGREEADAEKLSHQRSLLWYRLSRQRHSGGVVYEMREVHLDLSDDSTRNRVYVTESHTLVIRRSKLKDSGAYLCQEPDDLDMRTKDRLSEKELSRLIKNPKLRFMYHVDVMKPREVKVKKVSAKEGADGLPKPAQLTAIIAFNAKVYIHWEAWSPCSICDKPGTRKRIGLCHVTKLDRKQEAKPVFLDALLSSYAAGIPCRSTLFHGHETLRRLVSKPDEVMEEDCHVTCAEYHAQLLLSPDGFLGGDPSDPSRKLKPPERYVEHEGDSVTLKCPSSPVDLPALWVNGSTVLLATSVVNNSRGRADIDGENVLRISPILRYDSASYVCVVGGVVRGFVRLEVIPTPPDCKTCRYAVYLALTFPADLAVYLMVVYARHVQQRKARALRRRRALVD